MTSGRRRDGPFSQLQNLRHYLDIRCQQKGITVSAVAEQLKWPHNYIRGIYEGQFEPSKPRA
jgi:hypothetical protein